MRTKQTILFLLLIFIFNNNLKATGKYTYQNIVINQTFSNDSVIYPFKGIDVLYGLSVNANCTFNSDSSLIRIILRDENMHDFILYETYPMIDSVWEFSLNEACEETCFLDSVIPNSLIIQITDANIYVESFVTNISKVSNALTLQKEFKENRDINKINALNAYLINNNLLWRAGETYASLEFYESRTKYLFSKEKYNSYGYEYYKGGIFSIEFPDAIKGRSNTDYIDTYDWREKHSANNSLSPYYDGDELGGGWITPMTCQVGCLLNNEIMCDISESDCTSMGGEWRGAPTCWAFAPTAIVEAVTNLYFNSHIDLDLSEQQIAVCSGGGGCSGGFEGTALNYMKNNGIVDENCYPYAAICEPDISCSDMCLVPTEEISFIDYHQVQADENSIKSALIEYGPLSCGILYQPWGIWSHAMALVGYDIIEAGDIIRGVESPVSEDSPFLGQTYWILKQHRGTTLGQGAAHNGYVYMIFYENHMPGRTYAIHTPMTSLNYNNIDIQCLDLDNDGYYNWGIGDKPSHCPSCPNEIDGDDSNPNLGPLDENGYSAIIDSYNTSFELGFDQWKQITTDDCDFVRHTGSSGSTTTGPDVAQDGDYYLFLDSSEPNYANKSAVIISPPLRFNFSCNLQLDFWYHMHGADWNMSGNGIEVQISSDNGITWVPNIWNISGNQNDEWLHTQIELPLETNRIKIIATTGTAWYSDIAIDNISIFPIIFNETPLTINTNTIIDYEFSLNREIIIDNNSILTITNLGSILMYPESKITVKPGAKLIIDGGTLTNKCSGMWQGIVVKGNKYQSQYPESNQGVLEIKNGGLVEHARRAVYVGNPDVPWDNTAGGIVKISGAVFRDNIACVEIPSYRNGLANNRSYIVNSIFKTTDFLASVGEHPWAFISLWNVGIININGNTFINQNPDAYAFNERGKGLKSSDADFYLKPLLTFPGSGLIKNHFENLYKAVETENTGRLSVCDIDNNEFENNYFSLYVNSVDNANIVSNTFNADWQYAELYLTQSNGFHIENNDFNGQADGYGIWISDSPGENEIYRNRFNNNEYGIITEYDNTSVTGGLQLLCNTFTDNLQHIRVINPPGISNNQGSEALSAGNQFYPECSNGTGDIDNGGNQINYFSEHSIEYEPICNTNVNIFKAEHNTCPSKLNNQIPPGQITTLSDSINTVKTELAIVTDGGDTEGTTEDVENAEPDEALKLRNTLLEKSPNLSDTVMVSSTSVEDVLPSIMVKQVLASNPGAAKSDHVQNALDNRQNQLPQYMRDEINLGKDSLSYKEKLESKLSAFKNKRENLINRKITRLLLDTTEQSLDTIENLLTSENSLHRVYQLVNFYISQNRIQDAQILFADIPQNFDLLNTQQAEYEKNAQFYTIKFALENSEKSWFEMSNEQKLLIHTLADDSTTNAGMQARAVLSLIENKDYGYPIPDIEEGGNKNANPDSENLPETFSVYPETAKDYFIIEYVLAEKENPKDVRIAIFDDAGKDVRNFILKTPANQFLIECENWKAGTYRCRKINKGKIAASEKVIIAGEYSENKNNKKTSGINNSEKGKTFDVYPNPAKEYVFVTYNIDKVNPGKTVLQITDSKGSTVKIIKLNQSENRIKISTSDFKKGVYTICLKTGGKIINTKKIVVK